MRPIIIIIHICVCIAMILIVLLQKGKGAGMGAAFGGSSQTVFGSGGGATFMHKVTTATAIVFMLTSLSLSFFFKQGVSTSSVMEAVQQTEIPMADPGAEPVLPPVETGETTE